MARRSVLTGIVEIVDVQRLDSVDSFSEVSI